MIDITLLGTSALMPLPDRALSAATLTCEGRTVLFDCGEGTQVQLRAFGISPVRIDLIALTHYHGDHVFGLPGLLQSMYCMDRKTPLYITGPSAGMKEILIPLLRMAGRTGYDIRLVEVPEEGLRMAQLNEMWPDGAKLAAFPTNHRVPSVGYSFELSRPGAFMPEKAKSMGIPVRLWKNLQKGETVTSDGRTFKPSDVMTAPRKGLKSVFSGDTYYTPDLVKASAGADLLICDGTYSDDEQQEMAMERGHMTFPLAARTALEAGVSRLWLTHMSQMITDPQAAVKNAVKVFPNSECGTDGKHIELRFENQLPESGSNGT